MENMIEFLGHIIIDPPLNLEELDYFNKFSGTRRMDRKKGPYFVEGTNYADDNIHNADVFDYNKHPKSQPGLWCKWIPTHNGKCIKWNGYERFYNPEKWLEYLIVHFFGNEPVAKLVHPEEFSFLETHILNGIIEVKETNKNWKIIVVNNNVSATNHKKQNVKNDLKNLKKSITEELMISIDNKVGFCTMYEDNCLILSFQNGMYKKYPLYKNE
jgi:hypothetical protein